MSDTSLQNSNSTDSVASTITRNPTSRKKIVTVSVDATGVPGVVGGYDTLARVEAWLEVNTEFGNQNLL
jgi:hypothetical protein